MERNKDIQSKFQDQSTSELPLELWHLIIEYCSIEDLLQLQFINNFFRSNVGDLFRKHIALFQTEIESHIKDLPGMLKLYEHKGVAGFDPELTKDFISPSHKSLRLLALVVSEHLLNLLRTRYQYLDSAWVPYNENGNQIQVNVPITLKFGYFSTMSIMRSVAGYLLVYDTSDVNSFWNVFTWIDYIITEKRAVNEYPRHYVLIGYVFADKDRAVQKFQAQYFCQMMGITYIEVDGEDVQGLDKVWPQMLNLFSMQSDVENINENNDKELKKKKKSQPCKTQ